MLGEPGTAEAVRDFLRRGSSLPPAERESLLARVHPLRRPQTLHCMQCHRAEGSLVDLAKVGYPAARREALVRPLVFQMIEHISAGQPMSMPEFFAPRTETPSSSPASTPAASQGWSSDSVDDHFVPRRLPNDSIRSPQVPQTQPGKAESFILVSPGEDGIYGTADDVQHLERLSQDH